MPRQVDENILVTQQLFCQMESEMNTNFKIKS